MPYADVLTPELPWASGSETSHDAAVRARDFVGPQGAAVLAVIADSGGLTQKEIAARGGWGRPSVCALVRALELAGDIEKVPGLRRDGCAVYARTR